MNKKTLKSWFSNDKKTTQEQFREWIDSYENKNETIPLTDDNICKLIPKVSENPTQTALSYEILQSLYPTTETGEIIICPHAGFKYEKTQTGWIEYIIKKLTPNLIIKCAFSNISSPMFEEITRASQIKITKIDTVNKRFTCDLSDLEPLKEKGINGEPWFISQGSEADSFCELLEIDNEGYIYYSEALSGTMMMAVGQKVEFFNPFVNYQILNSQRPTLATSSSTTNIFTDYPATLNGKPFKYLVNTGLIKKQSDNKYRIYLSAVGSGETFIAEDADINGSFKLMSETPFLDAIEFWPEGRTKGTETLLWGIIPMTEKFVLDTGVVYIGLLSVKDTKGLNYAGYVYLNKDGDLLTHEVNETKLFQNIDPNLHLTGLAFFNNKYHFILKKWGTGNKLTNYSYHCITKDITELGMNFFDIIGSTDTSILEKITKLHQGSENNTNNSIFYGQGDFSLFTYSKNLYMFYCLEPLKTGFINTNNRMCGIAIWDYQTFNWDYQNGLQFINPIQIHKKYPNLFWCFDHWGNLINPYFENENMYIGTTLATDNPDYFPAVLKMKI